MINCSNVQWRLVIGALVGLAMEISEHHTIGDCRFADCRFGDWIITFGELGELVELPHWR